MEAKPRSVLKEIVLTGINGWSDPVSTEGFTWNMRNSYGRTVVISLPFLPKPTSEKVLPTLDNMWFSVNRNKIKDCDKGAVSLCNLTVERSVDKETEAQ